MAINNVGSNFGMLSSLSTSFSSKSTGNKDDLLNMGVGSDSFSSVFAGQTDKSQGQVMASEKSSSAAKDSFEKKNSSTLNNSSDAAGKTEGAYENSKLSEETSKTHSEDAVGDYEENADLEKETSDKDASLSELEALLQNLMSAGAGLLDQVAEVLAMDPAELQSLLNDQGLDLSSLTDGKVFQSFVMEALGAEDSMALLTDENRFQQFKVLMEEFDQIMEDAPRNDELLTALQPFMEESGKAEELTEDSGDYLSLLDTLKKELDAVKGMEDRADKEPSKDVEALINTDETDLVNRLQNPASGQMNQQQFAGSQQNTFSASSLKEDGSEGEKGNAMLNGQLSFGQAMQPEMVSELATPEPVTSYASTQEIANQILDFIRTEVKEDLTQIEMQLTPATLGSIQISVANKNGMMTANFVAESESARAAIENQMVVLRESLEQQGVKVEAIEVSVATHSFEQNLEQEQHSKEQQEAQKKGIKPVRRLTIGPDMSMDDLELLSEEEKLAAEMMISNGQTVDLQA